MDRQQDGQNCLWWSQGCSIGCSKCATNAEGPYSPGPFGGEAPQAGKIGFRTRYCNSTHNSEKSITNPTPLINSTLPKEAWSLNIGATEGAEDDSYRFNPWRAPGYAPVVDPCGQAGGEYKGQHIGGDSVFTDTNLSKMGDLGSNLPASKILPRWVAGTQVEVAWGPRYNVSTAIVYQRSLRLPRVCHFLQHGGGYSYRLCKGDQELTEECFQKTPLAFDKTKQTLVWNTKEVPVNAGVKAPTTPANGTLRLPVPNPVFVSEGTWPKGSMWARDPIPRIQDGRAGLHPHTAEQGGRCPDGSARAHNASGCLAFPAPCSFDTGMLPCAKGEPCDGNGMGACSSDWVVGLISDEVIIPKDLDPGHWVLSWRWGEFTGIICTARLQDY